MAQTIGCFEKDGIEVLYALPASGVLCPHTYGITVFLEGEGKVSLNGAPLTITPYALMLYGPGDICYFHNSETLKCLTFLFDPTILYGDVTSLLSSYEGAKYRLPHTHPANLTQLVAHLPQMGEFEGDHGVMLARMKLSELLLHMSMTPVNQAPQEDMARVAAYLGAHAEEDLSLDSLSLGVGISKFHLLRRFRDEVGMTPHTYLGYVRVLRAQDLLAKGVPAAGVAKEVGFQDYSTFFRTYKRLMGVAPVTTKAREVRL